MFFCCGVDAFDKFDIGDIVLASKTLIGHKKSIADRYSHIVQ